MEGLTRLVTESLARHGFDRPVDYRRLHWSRWFRCESLHSLLFVPSKPGVFALAEEIMAGLGNTPSHSTNREGHDFSRAARAAQNLSASAAAGIVGGSGNGSPEALAPRCMLAVTQFFEDDDMAFVLDRMLSRQNPMRARLASGRYFVRFVVIEDQAQRRSICGALNQWIVSSGEKASGIGAHFATSLELTSDTDRVGAADATEAHRDQAVLFAAADATAQPAQAEELKLKAAPVHPSATAPQLDSGAATNLHCPSPFPSGF